MACDKNQIDQLYEDIRRDEVCYVLGNAIYRQHDRLKGFMYSVNNTHTFEMFSEALDYIYSLENVSSRQ